MSIGKNAFNLTVAQVATLAISTVSSMMLARFRTVEEYGTYSQITIAVTLFITAFTLGLPNSINFFLSKADSVEEKKDFLAVFYTFTTAICLVIGAVLALAEPVIARYFRNPAIRGFAYALFALPLSRVITNSIDNVLVVYSKSIQLIVFKTARSLITLSVIFLAFLLRWGFQEYMILFVASELIVTIWAYLIIAGLEGRLRLHFDRQYIKAIMMFSIPLGLSSIIGTITVELDKLMIGRFLDTRAFALYANAGKELPFTIIASAVSAVLLPQLVRSMKRNDFKQSISLWGDTVIFNYVFMCFVATACVVFAPQLMTILYSTKYIGGVSIFRIYGIILILRTTYFGIILNALGETKFIFLCTLITLVLNVVLNYILFKFMGLIGPAIATLVSIAFVDLLQLYVTSKKVSIPFTRIFPWRKLGDISFTNLVWGIVAWIASRMLGLGADKRGVLFSFGLGVVVTIGYSLMMKKDMRLLWNSLNQEKS